MIIDSLSPVQNTSYINKDFEAIYEELLTLTKELTYKWDPTISNESDPGVVLLKLNAIIGDKLNYNIDKNVLECFPLSVTQEGNARQLFEQGGYSMKWYQSAVVPVSIKWTADNKLTSYTIPAFTKVCDYNNTIIYTLIGPNLGTNFVVGDQQLNTNGTIVEFKAIQGIPVRYNINGEELIKYSMLDSNNRLYFSTNDIAENGIFITNSSARNYGSWHKVDNLTIESVSPESFNYKFGVTTDGMKCYLEFPDNAETIFGEGIYITYIRTLGLSGNVPIKTIEKFYTDLVPAGSEDIILNSDNTYISNDYPATNGENPETINQAYKNYKRTIGTYDTLITLRDYFNYIVKSKLVSNCVVSDRGNDIQSTYKIASKVNGLNNITTQVIIDSTTEEKELNAYNIRFYLLQYEDIVDNYTSYNRTFEMMNNSEIGIIEDYIKDVKAIPHDYAPLLDGRIAYFINKYPIQCTISTQYSLTNTEASEVINNIKKALYQNLNSKEIDFGVEITVTMLKDIIINADKRIKDVVMPNIEFKTYAMVYEDDNFVSYLISEEPTGSDEKAEKINSLRDEIYAKSVLAGVTQFYKSDEEFDYHINQTINGDIIKDIVKIDPRVTITINGSNSDYLIRDNENIRFFAPNLIEVANYSNYVKFDYIIANNVSYNTNYQLHEGEYVALFWKNTDDEELYTYVVYSQGNVICPSFDLTSKGSFSIPDVGTWVSTLTFENVDNAGSTVLVANPTYSGNITANVNTSVYNTIDPSNVLSGNKRVGVKRINNITLDSQVNPCYCYWYLNDNSDRFILFDETTPLDSKNPNMQFRVLDVGEYFFYANPELTQLNILGAGTKLLRPASNAIWAVMPSNLSTLLNGGISSIVKDDWFQLTSSSISIVENQFINLGAGAKIKVNDIGSDTITITKQGFSSTNPNKPTVDDYDIQYQMPGGSFVSIPKIDVDIDSWDAKSLLNVNVGKSNKQVLLNGQSIICTKDNGDEVTIVGAQSPTTIQVGSMRYRYSINPVVILSNVDVNFSGDGTLTTIYEDEGEEKYLDIYSFKELIGSVDDTAVEQPVTYINDSNELYMIFKPNDSSISIKIGLPVGEYVLPIFIPSGQTFSGNFTVRLSNSNLHQMYSINTTVAEENITGPGMYYFYLNITDTNEKTLTVNMPSHTKDVRLSIYNIYKYTYTDDYSTPNIGDIQNLIATLDINHNFDYSYEVDTDIEIEDPLDASLFLDPYHPFNAYTICQMETNDRLYNQYKILNIRRS